MKMVSIMHLTDVLNPKDQNVNSLSNTRHLELFRLVLNSEFQKKVKKIRESFNIDTDEISNIDTDEAMKTFISFMENPSLAKEVDRLIKDLKLSSDWHNPILRYVIDEDSSLNHILDGLKLETTENGSEKIYKLVLSKRTTLEEIKLAWPAIQKELGNKGNREKSWKKFWRDFDIWKMADDGKTVTEIEKFIKDEYGDDLDYGNIIKIESSFRKKHGILKRNKLKINNL